MYRFYMMLMLAGIALSAPAHAELYFMTTLMCNERSVIENNLKVEYGETLYSVGSGEQDHADRLYRNLDKDTYTLTKEHGHGFDCILDTGDGWQDLAPKHGKEGTD